MVVMELIPLRKSSSWRLLNYAKEKSKKYSLVLEIRGFPLPGQNFEMRFVMSKLNSDSEISSWVLPFGKKSLLNIDFLEY